MKILRIGCVLGGFLSLALSLSAQTFTSLLSFNDTDGAFPVAPLAQGTDGNLYGTTSSGGANEQGTVFKITPNGKLTTLYSFCSQSGCADGSAPQAGLVQAANRDFYGTTESGGFNDCGDGHDRQPCGTIFKIASSGALTPVHKFHGPDGANPVAPLVQAIDGYLYGTTSAGGDNEQGTVFKITPNGKLTTLYSFCSQSGCADGSAPQAGLVQAANGNFYGTTENGGAFNDGTVFKITQSGRLTTLHNFDGTDGSGPAGLIQSTDGNLYGTTVYAAKGGGTVFKITPGGKLTTLYTFCSQSNCTDGAGPAGALIQATDGNFYGTTVGGGASDGGTIFDVTPTGNLTTLYSFDFIEGYFPNAALIQATNGKFYGTTENGGTADCIGGIHHLPCGTVFSLSVGLGPFVKTLPAAGKVGAKVEILGTKLTGTTNVYFNTTPAQFEVVSPTLILTHVPTGAATGKIDVQFRPSHFILFSSAPFYVLR